MIAAGWLAAQPGQRPKSDRLAPKVLALVAGGRSYRLVGREVGLSKSTVVEIVKRSRGLGNNGTGKLCSPPIASTAEVDGELLVH